MLVLLLLAVPLIVGLAVTTQNIMQRAATLSPEVGGQWGPHMNWPVVAVHMLHLHTGDILMWQGYGVENPTTAKIWNPMSPQIFTETPVNSAIFCAGHAALADGRLLVAGGHKGTGMGIKDVNIFDPIAKTWTRVPDMKYARWYPSVTTLADGRDVIMSGKDENNRFVTAIEIYDPASNTVSELAGVRTAKLSETPYPITFLLPSGKIAVYGADSGKLWTLDVANKKWQAVGRSGIKNGSAVMYQPGKLLVTGGGTAKKKAATKAVTIDWTNGTPRVTSIAPMHFPRYNHNLVILPNGSVLAVGGAKVVKNDVAASSGILPAELWNPATQSWTTMNSMSDPRMYHSTALLLPDGMVVSAGTGTGSSIVRFTTGELFSPPYLFQGPRPTIDESPDAFTYNTTVTISTSQAASIAKVSLIRLGANTHRSDYDQRYMELPLTKEAGQITVTAPENGNIAPPGYYMLFLNTVEGVPSNGKIIKLEGDPGVPSASTIPSQERRLRMTEEDTVPKTVATPTPHWQELEE